MSIPPRDRYVWPTEAARLVGVSPQTIRRHLAPALLTPCGHRRYLRSQVEALRAELAGGAS